MQLINIDDNMICFSGSSRKTQAEARRETANCSDSDTSALARGIQSRGPFDCGGRCCLATGYSVGGMPCFTRLLRVSYNVYSLMPSPNASVFGIYEPTYSLS